MRSSGPQASPSPATPELAPRPRDPVPVPAAANAFVLLFLPPALSLVHPALYLPALIFVLLTPLPGLPRAFSPPPLSPPNGNSDADNQRSIEAMMDSFSEDDRPRATQYALSSSPPPRTRRGGEGGAQNTRSLPGSRSRLGRVPTHRHPLLSSSSAGGERPRRRFPGAEAAAIGSGGGVMTLVLE